jgi:hypothetical protein
MKRVAVASLWFFAAFCVHELAWSMFESPRILGLAFGAAAAAFVLLDPLRLLTSAPATAETRLSAFGSTQPVAR